MKATLILSLLLLASCATTKPDFLPEDQMFITRKYIGDFVSCENLEKRFGDPPLTIIKTNGSEIQDVVIYAKDCGFVVGDRLYVVKEYKRTVSGLAWVYELNSGSNQYRISEFVIGSKLLTQTWY